MKEIPLTQGQVAMVDDEDYEMLMNFSWHTRTGNSYNKPYVVARIPKSANIGAGEVLMHRLIMLPNEWMEVDHIDGNTFNNQKLNLRIVNHRENAHNLQCYKTSRFPGVDFHKATNKWRATIRINGKKHHLGLFEDEEEAFLVYKDACESIDI